MAYATSPDSSLLPLLLSRCTEQSAGKLREPVFTRCLYWRQNGYPCRSHAPPEPENCPSAHTGHRQRFPVPPPHTVQSLEAPWLQAGYPHCSLTLRFRGGVLRLHFIGSLPALFVILIAVVRSHVPQFSKYIFYLFFCQIDNHTISFLPVSPIGQCPLFFVFIHEYRTPQKFSYF